MPRIIVASPVCRCATTPDDSEVTVIEAQIDYEEFCANTASLLYDGEIVGEACLIIDNPVEDMIDCLNQEYAGLAVFVLGEFPNLTITITVPPGNDPELYTFDSSFVCE